jgi:hypothetical protein
MQLLPNGKQSFFTASGQPLANGKVYFYQPGTSTPATTYQDAGGQTPNANPVVLDGNGQAVIYGSGSYRQVVEDANGVTIWDQVTTAPDAGFIDLGNTANGKGADLVAGAAKKVASIAALRALRVPQGSDAQTVIVDGYAAVGDGGGGTFKWWSNSTTADDGGIYINPNGNSGSGRWLRAEWNIFARVNPRWFGAKGDYDATAKTGTDDTAAIQSALNCASAKDLDVGFNDGNYLVTGTLNSGNAGLYGNLSRTPCIYYTGTSNLLGNVSVWGIKFYGPGQATAAVGLKIVNGYKDKIENCDFRDFGESINISGSGQRIANNYFGSNGISVHVVKYNNTNNDPTTTFTSEGNWYESSNKGLWIDSSGASGGFISCCSINDKWQLHTGYGLYIDSAGFPFTLINPHTEQNCASAGQYGIGIVNSYVTWIGGYQAGTEVNSIDSASTVNRLAFGGTMALSKPYTIGDGGSITALSYDPSAKTLTLPANSATQTIDFNAGGYGAQNTAMWRMEGGKGDSGSIYGNFVQSARVSQYGNGVTWSLGTITAGTSDSYVTCLNMDYVGNFYPTQDNSRALGSSTNRWSTVYAGTGTINTSDAREKTAVSPLTDAEINAAKALAKEIGTYQWLESVKEKGGQARLHVGFTVQRAIEILQSFGLDPMRYGFICYDAWPEQPETTQEVEYGNLHTADGRVFQDIRKPDIDSPNLIGCKWETTRTETEVVLPYRAAGDRYAFRYDELSMFLARGFEARLAALEAK